MTITNFNQLLERSERRFGDRPVVTMDGETWSYARLAATARRVSRLLYAAGIRKGDSVGILLANQPMFLACMFGVAGIGALPVLINAFYGPKEIVGIATHSGIELLLVQPRVRGQDLLELIDSARAAGSLPALQTLWVVADDPTGAHPHLQTLLASDDAPQLPADIDQTIGADDLGVCIYTSGTTGHSKGVLQTYDGLLENARVTAGLMAYSDTDVLLPALPLFSSAGISLTLISVWSGTHMVLIDRNNADIILETIENHRVTILDMVPSGLKLLMKFNERRGRDVSSLRLVVVGGDSSPPDVGKQVLSDLSCNFAVVYGLTETGPVVSITRLDDDVEQKVATVGPPIDGMEVAIRDHARCDVAAGEVGEVCCRGRYVLPGYLHNQEATDQCKDRDGWFYTGDLGYLRPDGRLVIVGRKKDMILIGGNNVFPSEVEAHLIQHPGIKEVAVVGIESATRGNYLSAFVLAKDPALDVSELRGFCGQLAAFKVPRNVVIVEQFPYTGSGKVDKRALLCQHPDA